MSARPSLREFLIRTWVVDAYVAIIVVTVVMLLW